MEWQDITDTQIEMLCKQELCDIFDSSADSFTGEERKQVSVSFQCDKECYSIASW